MNKKWIWLLVALVLILLIVFFRHNSVLKDGVGPVLGDIGSKMYVNSTSTPTTNTTGSKATTLGEVVKSKSATVKNTSSSVVTTYPEIDFIDKRLALTFKNYQNVSMTIEKVVYGRGDSVVSTGCFGMPNPNFSTYLYPGSGLCINAKTIDGSPLGIVAVHALIENNGSLGFGGINNMITLHYLRASQGIITHRFADPILGMASYYIKPYSSREVVLSYLVPEDQSNFDLVFDYSGELRPDPAQSIYNNSNGGVFIDFKNKDLKLITN